MTDAKRRCEVHIIPGTHWDREWRYNFEETRQRLILMLESTMDLLEKHPEIPGFVLDGQYMPVKDYLDVRPENTDRLKKLICEGRLLIGPWYSLPDFFVILGESTVRNLFYGVRKCSAMGKAMMEGMTNSSWGQISQMPQILRGFGIDTYASYHGVPGHDYPVEFWWQAPDGSKVLFIRSPGTTRCAFFLSSRKAIAPKPEECETVNAGSELVKNAYRMTDTAVVDGSPLFADDTMLPVNYDKLYEEFRNYLEKIRPEVATENIMMGELCDAQHMYPDIVRMVEEIRKRHKGDDIHLSTIPEYFAKIKKQIGKLRTFEGEMRFPHKNHFAFRLCNILATRMYLKQANRRTEYLLTRWTEPFAAIANLLGNEYPVNELDQAWEMMFVNHSHDAIGGCSVDDIHDDMMWRFGQIQNRCRALLHRSLGTLARNIGKMPLKADESRLVIFNPLPLERNQIIEAYIDIPASVYHGQIEVFDSQGSQVPSSVLNTSMAKSVCLELQLLGCPAVPIRRLYVEIDPGAVPGLGYKELKLVSSAKTKPAANGIKADDNWMENEHLKITFLPDGSFDLLDKNSGQEFSGLHYFEDGGMDRAARNSWYLIPPRNDAIVSSRGKKSRIKLVHCSALQAKIEVNYSMHIPKSLDLEDVTIGRMEHFTTYRYDNRSSETVELVIKSVFILKHGAKRLDIETQFVNNALDHRLRVMFPTDVMTDKSWADAPFDVVSRPIARYNKEEWAELRDLGEVQTSPMTSFVDLESQHRSLAVIGEGLPEYDVFPDERRTVALTLVRSILHGRIDPETRIPPIAGSQCLGEHEFRYSIYPHQGDWEKGRVYSQAQEHNIPMTAVQCMGAGTGKLASCGSLISFDKGGIEISGIKKSHNGNKLVVRLFNPTTQIIKTVVQSGISKIKSAVLTNMLEEPIPCSDLKLTTKGVQLEIPAKKILTVLLEI
jgi:mannosylglycerate hydrolase